jgi:hypothetical protein
LRLLRETYVEGVQRLLAYLRKRWPDIDREEAAFRAEGAARGFGFESPLAGTYNRHA